MGVRGQRHAPAALSPGKTRYLLYRRLGGTQGRSGPVRKIWLPQSFDPQAVQELAASMFRLLRDTFFLQQPKHAGVFYS